MSEQQMRHDPVAERAVLAACMDSRPALEEAKRHLTGPDFYEPAHETMWNALIRLSAHGKAIDHATILAAVRHDRAVVALLPDLVTTPSAPDHVASHAEIVRSWATRRRIEETARRVLMQALNPDKQPTGFAATVANEFNAIRDAGTADEPTAYTMGELLAQADDAPDWLIPGYLERRDRFMLTGEEGLGKSQLLRQFAVSAAAGIDPFRHEARYQPVRSLIIDCENSERQVRTKLRGIAGFAAHYGDPGVMERVFVKCARRMDVTRDKDLALIHRELDLWSPDLVVIGPLYRLLPKAIQSDDEAAPVLAALDTIRDRGITLLMEAHAGHSIGKGGGRDMRPRGSSALLGWPEFGYGMRRLEAKGYCEFTAWRGDRSEREWPHALRHAADGHRWVPYEGTIESARGWAS